MDFAYSSRDDVAVLVATPPNGDEYIVTFDAEGKLKSTLKLDNTRWRSRQFVPLPDGQFVIVGTETTKDKPANPAIWIFDSAGRRVRRVLPEDLKVPATDASAAQKSEYGRVVSFSTIDHGSDGSIYLMRFGKKGVVYVLSSGGGLSRTLRPEIPDLAYLNSIKEHQGRLLLMLVKNKAANRPEIAQVHFQEYGVDGALGREFYHSIPVLGTALACYDGETLTFVGSAPDGRLRLVHAAPQMH
ncbi:MAG: hypothetical protein ACRD3A_05180 [Terriglobales bacterium]